MFEELQMVTLVEVYGNTGGGGMQRDSGRSVQIDFNAGAMKAGAVDKEAGSRSWKVFNGVRHLNLFYK